jgi:hypothetical protein
VNFGLGRSVPVLSFTPLIFSHDKTSVLPELPAYLGVIGYFAAEDSRLS